MFAFFNLEMEPALRVEPTGDRPSRSSGLPWIFRASEFCAFPERLDSFNLGGIFTFWQGALVPTDLPPGLFPWTWIYACIALDDTDDLHPGWTNGTRC